MGAYMSSGDFQGLQVHKTDDRHSASCSLRQKVDKDILTFVKLKFDSI